jgi:predicted transcriptional regulator
MSRIRVYTSAEVAIIHQGIPYGEKKAIAKELGIKPAALSRYINARKGLGYRIPQRIYEQIIQIITKNKENGNEQTNIITISTASETNPFRPAEHAICEKPLRADPWQESGRLHQLNYERGEQQQNARRG